MAYAYPIWVKVTNCNLKNNPDHGFKKTGKSTIAIGSSVNNSFDFVSYCITKRSATYKAKEVLIFRFSVDDVVLKYSIWTVCSNGRAVTQIKTVTKLNRIKSLKLKI